MQGAQLHPGEGGLRRGVYGIGESYGSPGAGVKEQILS